MTTDKRLGYSVTEAGKLLGLSRASAYNRAADGTMPTKKMGRRLIVPAWFLHEFESKPDGTADQK